MQMIHSLKKKASLLTKCLKSKRIVGPDVDLITCTSHHTADETQRPTAENAAQVSKVPTLRPGEG